MSSTFTQAVEFDRREQGINYYTIPQFGEGTTFDAIHFVDEQGYTNAIVIEPLRRNEHDWTPADEEAFQAAAFAEARQWDKDSWAIAQIDPERDQVIEINR